MNVTVMLATPLRAAVEGRKTLELGVPPTANVGDVLQSLFALYPRLVAHVPNERQPIRQHLGAVLTPTTQGRVLYLFASPSPQAGVGRRSPGGK